MVAGLIVLLLMGSPVRDMHVFILDRNHSDMISSALDANTFSPSEVVLSRLSPLVGGSTSGSNKLSPSLWCIRSRSENRGFQFGLSFFCVSFKNFPHKNSKRKQMRNALKAGFIGTRFIVK